MSATANHFIMEFYLSASTIVTKFQAILKLIGCINIARNLHRNFEQWFYDDKYLETFIFDRIKYDKKKGEVKASIYPSYKISAWILQTMKTRALSFISGRLWSDKA